MKKQLFVFAATFCFGIIAFAQPTLLVKAPQDNSTTQVRAPNGLATYAYMRACALVRQSELTALPAAANISQFGFTLTTGTSVNAVAGNFTVFLENTGDVTYNKGTNWATITTGMTQVYASVMTIPLSTGATSIVLTLPSAFTYTGGGLYVAYDWFSSGPFSSTPATYLAEGTALTPGCASGNSGTSAPTTLGTTAFRPSFLFGYANPYTNDIEIIGVEAPGRVNVNFNSPHTVSALVKNSSNGVNNNINVNLNITGANPSSAQINVPTLASGATTLVTFTGLNPQVTGLNTISVSVGSDQNLVNNSATYDQSVTCNEWATNPATGSYTSNSVGFNTASGILATPYANPVTSTLTGIRTAIGTNTLNPGNQIYGVLLSAAGAVIATTNTITITGAMMGNFQTFTFSTPPVLAGSTNYHLGMAQMANPAGGYPAGSQFTSHLPANLYYSTGITGGALTPITQNFGYFALEGIFATDPVPVVATPSVFCNGESATLTASNYSAYTWSHGPTTASITVSPSIFTTYSVAATSTNGCASSGVISVSVMALPNVNATANTSSICLGGTVSLAASGASTYVWNTSQTSSTFTDNPSTTTVYSVVGTASTGCTNSKSVSVTVDSFTPTISADTTVCKNSPVTLVAGGGANYVWDTGWTFNSLNFTASVTVTHSVKATGSNGCVGGNTVTVFVNPQPTVNASATRSGICRNESSVLTASGAATYSWTNNLGAGNVVTFTSNVSTTHSISVVGTDNNGCSDTAIVAVSVSACTGLADLNAANGIRLVPNPSNGSFMISLSDYVPGDRIQIFDVAGRLVKEFPLTGNDTGVDISSESKGIYFVWLISHNEKKSVTRLSKD